MFWGSDVSREPLRFVLLVRELRARGWRAVRERFFICPSIDLQRRPRGEGGKMKRTGAGREIRKVEKKELHGEKSGLPLQLIQRTNHGGGFEGTTTTTQQFSGGQPQFYAASLCSVRGLQIVIFPPALPAEVLLLLD